MRTYDEAVQVIPALMKPGEIPNPEVGRKRMLAEMHKQTETETRTKKGYE